MRFCCLLLISSLLSANPAYSAQTQLQNVSQKSIQPRQFVTSVHQVFQTEEAIRATTQQHRSTSFQNFLSSQDPIAYLENTLKALQSLANLFEQYRTQSIPALNYIDQLINNKYKGVPPQRLKLLKRDIANWQYWPSDSNLSLHGLNLHPIPLMGPSGLHLHSKRQQLFEALQASTALEDGFSYSLFHGEVAKIKTLIKTWTQKLEQLQYIKELHKNPKLFHAPAQNFLNQLKEENKFSAYTYQLETMFQYHNFYKDHSYALWLQRVPEYIESSTLEAITWHLPIELTDSCDKSRVSRYETLALTPKAIRFFTPLWSTNTKLKIICTQSSWGFWKEEPHTFTYDNKTQTIHYNTSYSSTFEAKTLNQYIKSLTLLPPQM